jgi:UDP-glucose-4-epimerase GalE
MRNVLVTGGAGFIGSHACKALAAQGYNPIAYDNLSRGNRWAVKWGPFEQGDIAHRDRIMAVVKAYNPIGVMHFAAYAYVGESMESPLAYYENNVSGSVALLGSILSISSMPFVFSSSCATYGIPSRVPISENHPQTPINPYGRSKFYVEQLLRDLGLSGGLSWIALRYFNAAGADPEGQIGEAHNPETHLIPAAIIATQSGEPLRIFGTDYKTPDGTCVRDFVHVSDIAEAHVAALKYLLGGGTSQPLNLANRRGYSVKDVLSVVEEVTGRLVPVEYASRRAGDPPILIGDGSRARVVLGWEPQRSDLATQVRDTWKWLEASRRSSAAK